MDMLKTVYACMKFLTNTQSIMKRHDLIAACSYLVNQIVYVSRDTAYNHKLDFRCV